MKFIHKYVSKMLIVFVLLLIFTTMVAIVKSNENKVNSLIYNSKIQSDSINIVIVGDPQRTLWVELWRENNDEIRKVLFDRICQEKPSEIILLGDMVSFGSDVSEWQYFDSLTACLRAMNTPFFPILGNHDYFGLNSKALRNFYSRFPGRNVNNYYYFVKDSIAFVMLNSNFSELNKSEIIEQNQFLDSTLKSCDLNCKIKSVIVCWHHPAYTNSLVVDDDYDVRREFLPFIKKSKKIKIVFSGHAHTFEHFLIDSINFVVSGGGGGPRQRLKSPSKKDYTDLYQGEELREFHFCKIIKREGDYIFQMIAYDSIKNMFIIKEEWKI